MLSERLQTALNRAFPLTDWAEAVYGARIGGLTRDACGNLYKNLGGEGKKLLIVAPTAVEGLIAESLDETGTLHCGFTAGLSTRHIFNREVRFSNGAEGVMRPVNRNGNDPSEKKPRDLTPSDMYVDFGTAFDKTGIRVGDTAVFTAKVRHAAEGVLCGASFGAALPCEALCSLAEENIAPGKRNVTVAFATENGLPFLMRSLCPDEVLLLGICPAKDGPDGEKNGLCTRFDGGPAVMLRMGSIAASRSMTDALLAAAQGADIPVQTAYRAEEGRASVCASFGAGVTELCVPVRHLGMGELVREDEFKRFFRLLSAFIAQND